MTNDLTKLRRRATYASISLATLLILAKLWGYLETDSVAMLSSLLDSTIDLLASLVTAFGVASALRPPDDDHRFGHGKAEPLASLAQAAFIIGSAVLLGYEALGRFYRSHPMQQEATGYWVMTAAIFSTVALVYFQSYVVRRTNSLAISGDRLHYIGDLAVNCAVVVALLMHQYLGLNWIDPAFAIVISISLCTGAWIIAKQALRALMDEELPEAERQRIHNIASNHKGVRRINRMRTRSDSDRIFVELDVAMDGNLTLSAAHDIAENITDDLRQNFPNADITVHQEPAEI